MIHALTFVASKKPLSDKHLQAAIKIAAHYNVTPGSKPVWLAKNKAADLFLPQKPAGALLAHLREEFAKDGIDLFTLPTKNRRKKLLLADMESTIVDKEALDELAKFAGLGDKIAAITARAMEGKLDFRAALMERVGLLKNLESSALQKVLESMAINPGAADLVRVMKANGATCVLVSGGFTFFTGPVAEKTGFDHHHGNALELENNKLTGAVAEPILDKFAKLDFLKSYVAKLHLAEDDVMAVGDGANDIPMLRAAGFGVGYYPKEAVAREIDNLILHGDFTAALYAQGYTASDLA